MTLCVCVVFFQHGVTSHNENMQYVNLAVRACAQRQTNRCSIKLNQDQIETRPVKRDSAGQIRKNSDPLRHCSTFSVPFGPHLMPVPCQQKDSPETRSMTTKDLEVESRGTCEDDFAQDCAVSSGAAPRIDPTSAARLHQAVCECSPGFTTSKAGDCVGGTSDESRSAIVTTNDLLDCLLHPDIINRVTELLLERHTGSHRTTSLS